MTDLELDLGPDLHDLMDRSLTDVSVPTDRLQQGAVRRGRVLRRRRRMATAAAAVAAATMAAVLVAPGLAGSDPTEGGVAVDPPAAETPLTHPGWRDMPVEAMRDRLAALLPDDVEITGYAKRNTDHAPGESDAWAGVFTGTLRALGDVGPGSIEVMLLEIPRDDAARARARTDHLGCAGFPETWDLVEPADGAFCEESAVRAGQPYQRTITFEDQGVEYLEVRRWTQRGEIYVAVSSSTERKWGPPASAIHAPLTLAELLAVGSSPTWTTWRED